MTFYLFLLLPPPFLVLSFTFVVLTLIVSINAYLVLLSVKSIRIDRTPDLIAFGITLLMTCVLATGASKSVMFNNALNAINFATWVFIMAAGLFYVDTDIWHEHDGFLPFGWSGVSSMTLIILYFSHFLFFSILFSFVAQMSHSIFFCGFVLFNTFCVVWICLLLYSRRCVISKCNVHIMIRALAWELVIPSIAPL